MCTARRRGGPCRRLGSDWCDGVQPASCAVARDRLATARGASPDRDAPHRRPAGEEHPLRRRRPAPHARRLPTAATCHRAPRAGLLPRRWLYSGSKNREAAPLLHRLAGQGWVCISANYRLRPSASFPDHLVDAKKVIAWARAHGPEYGADPSVISSPAAPPAVTSPRSAALTPNDPALQPGFERADTSVTAAISLYGYYGRTTARRRGRPRSPTRAEAPPIFLAHGDHDTLVPVGAHGCWRPGCGHVAEPGRLCRAARRPARVRPVPFAAVRSRRRRDRGLHRMGTVARARPCDARRRPGTPLESERTFSPTRRGDLTPMPPVFAGERPPTRSSQDQRGAVLQPDTAGIFWPCGRPVFPPHAVRPSAAGVPRRLRPRGHRHAW